MKRNKSAVKKYIEQRQRTYWPMIYCLKEQKPIGISFIKQFGKTKVDAIHWKRNDCEFLDGYEIDMTQYNIGEPVFCPKCGWFVDFRFWMSDIRPNFN